jgi:hypothetical protein
VLELYTGRRALRKVTNTRSSTGDTPGNDCETL